MQKVAGTMLVLGLAVGLGCAKPTVGESVASEPDVEAPVPPPPIADLEPESLTSSDSNEAAGGIRTLEELMALAIYTPDPDGKALQQTKAARFDKVNGSSTVQFCIEQNGTTSDVRTTEKFPGDPMVDQILRDTIASWRFKPLSTAGFSGKVCTDRTFNIRFAAPTPPPAAN